MEIVKNVKILIVKTTQLKPFRFRLCDLYMAHPEKLNTSRCSQQPSDVGYCTDLALGR